MPCFPGNNSPCCDGENRAGFNNCAEYYAWKAVPGGYTAEQMGPPPPTVGVYMPGGVPYSRPIIPEFEQPLPEWYPGPPIPARKTMGGFSMSPNLPMPVSTGGVGSVSRAMTYTPDIGFNPTPPGGQIPGGSTGGAGGLSDVCALLPEPWKSYCKAGVYVGSQLTGCQTGFHKENGMCVPNSSTPVPGGSQPGTDATPGGVTPGEASTGATGLYLPMAAQVTRLTCPKYANGKQGILWMAPLTGQVVCLPRGVNGRGFGLIRKNDPRPKPYISHGEAKLLRKRTTLAKKAREFARMTGQSCSKSGRR